MSEETYPPPRHRRPLSEPPSPGRSTADRDQLAEGDSTDSTASSASIDSTASSELSDAAYADSLSAQSAWFEEQFGSLDDQQAVGEGHIEGQAGGDAPVDYDPTLAQPGQTRLPGLDNPSRPRPPGVSTIDFDPRYATNPGQHPAPVTGQHPQYPQQYPQPYPADPAQHPGQVSTEFYPQGAGAPSGYPQGYQSQQYQSQQYQPQPQPTAQYQNQGGTLDGMRGGGLPIIGAVVALLAAAALIGWMFTRSGGDQEVTIGGQADTSGTTEQVEEALPPLSPATLPAANEEGLVGLELNLLDPYTGTGSTGTVEMYLNSNTGQVCHTFDAPAIDGRYQAYVHEAEYPRAGPIVIDLGEVANGVPRCVNASSIDVTRALAESDGFYVAAHGPDRSVVLRSQLADATMVFDNRDPDLLASQEAAREAADQDTGDELFGSAEDGAYLVVDAGKVTFEGAVPDQATADRLQSAFIPLSGMGVEVIDNLTVQPGAPAPSGKVIVADALLFDTGQDQIDGDSPVLQTLGDLMTVNAGWTMTITGHTDNVGDYLLNIELSLRRANNMRNRLAELGVPAERIRVQGAGPEQPIDSNDTPEGRARNRRIEISIES